MKLIYIHIPKTGGTSINSFLPEEKVSGLWVANSDLDTLDPEESWDNDFLSGHFTRKQLMAWATKHHLDFQNVKIITVVRHPFDQLRSNLGFPYELQLRGEKVEEPWMLDMLRADPNSPEAICEVLGKHPWLLNLQWQYLISGSYLDEALSNIDRVFIYPEVQEAIDYCCEILGVEAPLGGVHENYRSTENPISREIMALQPLRDRILRSHALDCSLYTEAVRKRSLENSGEAVRKDLWLDLWSTQGGQSRP